MSSEKSDCVGEEYPEKMGSGTNKMTCDFTGKPTTSAFAAAIVSFVEGLGPLKREAKAQLSFGVKRKFLWLWAYEKTPDATLYLNVTLDHVFDHEGVHAVTQVSTNRWNHQVEVKSESIATSEWLRDLIREGYDFASQ